MIQDVLPRPELVVDGDEVEAWGHLTHVHEFHQFLYVPLGWISVTALGRSHRLSGATALWIPAGVPHSARFGDDALIISEDFDADRHRPPFDAPTTVTVTEPQHRLLLSGLRGTPPSDDELFAALMTGHRPCLPLPRPTSAVAAAVARDLDREPGDARTVEEWARDYYTSSTSLRRAFRVETGLPFSEWRTRLRLNRSLDLLDQGYRVGAVAARIGFASTNGYILAFRRHFDQTPGAYLRDTLPAPRRATA
ncbi:helix-turn-helix transcriptional regulator [Actinomadura hibisca]|uniref:helix-turn-helix transcriptional regulator n=1 Tax=Actinomadura hibisca TaxID=68565 RepID=UPI000A5164CA|nr:AraC family transcriptional regulator [Actinomadura hibisca]